MPVRLVATDLDGTFFSSHHSPAPHSVAVWNRVRASGIHVVAASGRSHFNGLPIVTDAGAELDWFIGSNGGHRLNVATATLEEHLTFDPHEPHDLYHLLQATVDGVGFGWEAGGGFLWDDQFLDIYPLTLTGSRRQGRTESVPTAVGKILIAHPELNGLDLVEHLEPHIPDHHNLTTSGAWAVEVTPNGADKGAALARLCAELGITSDEVIAFGDNQNDLSMMQWAGRSVAMANALPMVKAAASEITATNDDYGVARVLGELA